MNPGQYEARLEEIKETHALQEDGSYKSKAGEVIRFTWDGGDGYEEELIAAPKAKKAK